MLDDFLALIYKELIKGKIKDLKKGNPYSLKEKCSLELITKLDSVLGKFFKYIFYMFLLLILFKINIYLATLILTCFIFYKKLINKEIKESFKNKTSSLKSIFNEVVQDTTKLKVKSILVIVILLNFSTYTKFLLIILVTLLVFTINEIYSNIKNITSNSFNERFSK
ncbi:hypothetical protein [Tepidibacter formicigenes]|jgi:hypothetical protein|uniref:Uncharacterized protein n=1 Tax=Tepidibacter formicigenes DSM 15518 TaxID=1123349 RepID=A0A1M6P4T1_9FIRM|nr:hypothetical protein [Tepidibacter formicigenes]SHK02975.1 hypothetical protein SAMN02744037_01461 [Tepidibacter formicigenes DSM 15518]